MNAIADDFAYCGLPAYLIAIITGLGVCACIAALVLSTTRANRVIAIFISALAVVFGLIAIGVGVLGELSGRSQTDFAVHEMPETSAEDAAEHDILRAQGYAEARTCVSIGIGGGAIPLLFGLVLLTSAVLKKKSEDA